MSCWAVIPVKPPPDRKSRLSPALDPEDRDRLVRAMAAHVADVAGRARGIEHVAFIAACPDTLCAGVAVLEDAGGGLNGAARNALAQVAARGATRVVLVAGDLPLLTAAELERLVETHPGSVAIAPDRHGVGTNALALPLPAAQDFGFAFGPGSFQRHHAEAERLGLIVETVRGEGLARDIDEPSDLADAAALIAAMT